MLKTRGFEGYCIMEFSKRLDLFGDEIFAALNERKVALEAQGRTIYNLSVGTPDFAPAEHIRKACPKVFVFVPLGQYFVERFGQDRKSVV